MGIYNKSKMLNYKLYLIETVFIFLVGQVPTINTVEFNVSALKPQCPR